MSIPARTWGDGPPILLLHGVPTSGLLWRDVGPRLAGWRAIAPDLPGYGASPPLAHRGSGPSLEAHLDWLESAMEGLGLGACPVAGQDYGGLLAAGLAARGRATALAVTSSAAGLAWAPIRATALPGLERFFYRRYGGRLFLSRGVAPDRRDAFLDDHLPWLERHPDLPGQMRALAWRGLSIRRLARLPGRIRARGVPSLCLWGADDRFFPPAVGRWTARDLGGRFQAIPGARHYAPFCRPAAYAGALAGFLRASAG